MGDRRGGIGDVKNKQPAPMQISAEQILREARERQEDENYTAPAQKITDPEVRERTQSAGHSHALQSLRATERFSHALRSSPCTACASASILRTDCA